MVDIINELTKHSTDSTLNFLKSLKFIDNAFIIAKFFKELEENNIEYHIIKGFDYTEEDNNFSCFKVAYFACNEEGIDKYKSDATELSKISDFYIIAIV